MSCIKSLKIEKEKGEEEIELVTAEIYKAIRRGRGEDRLIFVGDVECIVIADDGIITIGGSRQDVLSTYKDFRKVTDKVSIEVKK